jgi:hypothetical protein
MNLLLAVLRFLLGISAGQTARAEAIRIRPDGSTCPARSADEWAARNSLLGWLTLRSQRYEPAPYGVLPQRRRRSREIIHSFGRPNVRASGPSVSE